MRNKNGQFRKGNKGFWLGKKRPSPSLKTLKKMSQSMMGKNRRPMSAETKEKIKNIQLGRKISEETKIKMSNSHKKRYKKFGYINSPSARIKISLSKKGEKSFFWKGGVAELTDKIRHLVQNKEWREAVFKRDNYLCKKCNDKKSGPLRAHHIKEFSEIIKDNGIKTIDEAILCEELWDINNGITLCKKCHDNIRQHEKEHANIFINILQFNYKPQQYDCRK